MPSTLDGRLLLGWMERDDAIVWLRDNCLFEPPMTTERATETWQRYKNLVEALPDRILVAPKRFPIPGNYQEYVNEFLKKCRGPEVSDVIRIDPFGLPIYQFYVAVSRADEYAKQMGGIAWVKACLPIKRPSNPMPIKVEPGVIKVALTHREHIFTLCPDGAFRIGQGAGLVCVGELNGRLFLKAGYHRSFAFCRAKRIEPDAKDRSLLLATTLNLPLELSTDFPNQGLRIILMGSRPALFSDFFDEVLAMPVKLLKKRYEMHITVNNVQVDEP